MELVGSTPRETKLSTYLGHISLAETQHYLTMTPDLLREAGRRFETYVGVEVQP